MAECNLCALSQTCLSVGLPGTGPKGGVMVVCDFPDSESDMEGVPHQGAVGDLLRSMLHDAGIDPASVYYTYALKCKPPKNRAPSPKEVDTCRVYLKKEIEDVRPVSIVAMGDYALRSLTKLSGVKDKRGKELALHDQFTGLSEAIPVFATYSPGIIARRPVGRSTVVSDLRRAHASVLRSLSTLRPEGDGVSVLMLQHADVSWSWWDGKEYLEGDVIAYDIEAVDENGNYTTRQLADGTYEGYPTQIAISNGSRTLVALGREQTILLAGQLLDRKTIVGHNSWGYDAPVMVVNGVPLPLGEDTMVLAYLVDEEQPLGLEANAVKWLGVPGWKEAFGSKLGSDEFAYYNARDTYYTWRLYKLFHARLGSVLRLAPLLRSARAALDGMTRRGVYVDAAYVESVRIQKIEESERLLAEIRAEVQPNGPPPKGKVFNPGSSDQLGAYLVLQRGLCLPVTPSGKIATNEKALFEYRDDPFIQKIDALRSARKTLSTYVKVFQEAAALPDGRTHTRYDIVRTTTGRSASKAIKVDGKRLAGTTNHQNLSRELKGFYGAAPGKLLVQCDYSAVEFRLAAWFASEDSILQRFAEDSTWDPHRFFAAAYYGIDAGDVTKSQRQVAKSANFSQLYLGNHVTLQEYMKKTGNFLPLSECWRIHQTWHQAFPGFINWYMDVREEILRTGMSVDPMGFERHFGDPKLITRHNLLNFLREGANAKVQGFSARVAFLALSRLESLGAPMVLFVHDSIGFEFESLQEYEAWKPEIEYAMTKYPVEVLARDWGVNLDVPLVIETEIKHGA